MEVENGCIWKVRGPILLPWLWEEGCVFFSFRFFPCNKGKFGGFANYRTCRFATPKFRPADLFFRPKFGVLDYSQHKPSSLMPSKTQPNFRVFLTDCQYSNSHSQHLTCFLFSSCLYTFSLVCYTPQKKIDVPWKGTILKGNESSSNHLC